MPATIRYLITRLPRQLSTLEAFFEMKRRVYRNGGGDYCSEAVHEYRRPLDLASLMICTTAFPDQTIQKTVSLVARSEERLFLEKRSVVACSSDSPKTNDGAISDW
ncbi:hypothetical protein TNCV_1826471 [Trichonephila clavipes]|nr:hypothetical protein TNCV_1826471 [Trichonephila clavipes]